MICVLLDAGGETEARDHATRTPIHLLSEDGGAVEVKLFIVAGADVMARDRSGATPLHYAARW